MNCSIIRTFTNFTMVCFWNYTQSWTITYIHAKSCIYKLASKSAEIHLGIYKTSSGVVISHNCYTTLLVLLASLELTTRWYLRFEYSILITEFLDTGTRIVLDTCRVTQYSGKLNLPELLHRSSEYSEVFRIRWSICGLLNPYGLFRIHHLGISNK